MAVATAHSSASKVPPLSEKCFGRPLLQSAGRIAVSTPSPRCGGGQDDAAKSGISRSPRPRVSASPVAASASSPPADSASRGANAATDSTGYPSPPRRGTGDGDFLDDYLSGAGSCAAGGDNDWFTTMCEDRTFLTTPDHLQGFGSDDDDEELLRKLQQAADGALSGADRLRKGHNSRQPQGTIVEEPLRGPAPEVHTAEIPEQAFIRRLRAAHAEALASGDCAIADAVADALRAEGVTVEVSRSHQTQPTSARKDPTSSPPVAAPTASAAAGQASAPAAAESHSTKEPPQKAVGRPQVVSASPPMGPRRNSSDRPLRRPRPACPSGSVPPVGELGAEPSASSSTARCGAAPRSARLSQREREIAQQLGCCSRMPEHTPLALEPQDETPQLLARLGCLHSALSEAKLLDRVAGQVQRCQEENLQSISGLNIHGLASDLLSEALPPSDLPVASRSALAAWARGETSGARCLLELEAAAPAVQGQVPVGRPSWPAVATLCGLAGGDAFGSGPRGRVWVGTFGQTPAGALRSGLMAVRAQVDIATGPITPEELHLGLRALELQSKCDDEGSVVGGCVQAQAWRELLSLYLRLPHSDARQHENKHLRHKGLACVLENVLKLGVSGVEEVARETHDDLRALPEGWEDLSKVLVGMTRCLKEALETIKTYGPYTALGVDVNTSDSDLKRAYREMCLKYHPDKGGDTVSFQQLQQAYETISDDRKRGVRPPPPPQAPSQQQSTTRQPPSNQHFSQGSHPSETSDAKFSSREHSSQQAQSDEANTRMIEAMRRIEELCSQAGEAAERARSAASAAEAAAAVVEDSFKATSRSGNGSKVDKGTCLEVLEASPELAAAMRSAAEDVEAAASAVSELSRCLVPACGTVSDGDLADEILQAAFQCTSQGTSASHVGSACGCFADEISQTFRAIGSELQAMDHDSEEFAMALQLLASAAARGREVAKDAADAAAAAACVAKSATAFVRRATRCYPERGKATGSDGQKPSWSKRCPSKGAQPEESRRETEERPSSSGSASQALGRRSPAGAPPRPSPRPSRSTGTTAGEGSDDGGEERPPSGGRASGGRQRQPGSARARSSSAGPRGWTEALVQRRMQAFEDIKRLDAEVRGLQRQVHDVLLKSPLLLRGLAGAELRTRLFGVVGEILLEEGERAAAAPSAARFEPLPFLAADGGHVETALCDVRLGALRLAALIDTEALGAVLTEQFLPLLLEARPTSEAATLRARVSDAVTRLSTWVSSRDH